MFIDSLVNAPALKSHRSGSDHPTAAQRNEDSVELSGGDAGCRAPGLGAV